MLWKFLADSIFVYYPELSSLYIVLYTECIYATEMDTWAVLRRSEINIIFRDRPPDSYLSFAIIPTNTSNLETG